jgi:hypothetical protein
MAYEGICDNGVGVRQKVYRACRQVESCFSLLKEHGGIFGSLKLERGIWQALQSANNQSRDCLSRQPIANIMACSIEFHRTDVHIVFRSALKREPNERLPKNECGGGGGGEIEVPSLLESSPMDDDTNNNQVHSFGGRLAMSDAGGGDNSNSSGTASCAIPSSATTAGGTTAQQHAS